MKGIRTMQPTLTLLAALLLLPLAALNAAEFHVASSGNDANPGTEAKPFAPLAAVSAEATSTTRAGDVLAVQIQRRVEAATGGVLKRVAEARGKAAKAQDFRDFVKKGQWTEVWPGKDGKPETSEVAGEVWNAAIQAALDRCGGVILPKQDKPYYLDGPIVLKSGQFLIASPDAEIRLKPGVNTCMVRNANPYNGQSASVPENVTPDENILVEGGVWTTLATMPGQANGNTRGRADVTDSVPGCHGVVLLQNVQRVVVRHLTIRQGIPFGVHLGTAQEFLVENLTFEDHRRDGVHCDGPASFGIIRGLRGKTGDDPVSLLAWDWRQYSTSFGPIHHILVEDVSGAPLAAQSTDAIRLLPGVKRFAGGATLDCPIHDITLRRITDIREFKFYDQPNLEVGLGEDFSAGIGTMKNIRLEDLTFNRPGKIELHANTDGLIIHNVKINHTLAPDWHLLAIGPKSMTYKGGPGTDPARWREIFSPDLDCTVRNVNVTGVRARDSQMDLPIEQVVRVIQQKLNPDYPKTTPKGGTGKGIWIR